MSWPDERNPRQYLPTYQEHTNCYQTGHQTGHISNWVGGLGQHGLEYSLVVVEFQTGSNFFFASNVAVRRNADLSERTHGHLDTNDPRQHRAILH